MGQSSHRQAQFSPQAGTLPEVLPQGIWLPPGHLIPEKMRGAGDIAQHRGLVQHARGPGLHPSFTKKFFKKSKDPAW